MEFGNNELLDMCRMCSLCYKNNETIEENYANKDRETKGVEKKYNILDKCCSIPIIKTSSSDCQYFVTIYNEMLLICFRGTESTTDILKDLNIIRTEFNIPNYNKKQLYVHGGFYSQFNDVHEFINKDILEYLDNDKYKTKTILFTGHSLGGALATLGACYFGVVYPSILVNCVTFGSPRVGCNQFIKVFAEHCNNSYRFVNENDPVPSFPSSWRFKHVKGCSWINNDKILNEILPWRFWRFLKNYCLSCVGYGYNALEDHYCANYINNLSDAGF